MTSNIVTTIWHGGWGNKLVTIFAHYRDNFSVKTPGQVNEYAEKPEINLSRFMLNIEFEIFTLK